MKLKLILVTLVMAALCGTVMANDGVQSTVADIQLPEVEAQAVPTPAAGAPEVSEDAPVSQDAPILSQILPELIFMQGPLPCGDGNCGNPGGGGSGGGGGYTCTATITCPGGTVGSHTIPPYSLSCSGYQSCAPFPNSSNPYAVVCDGIGTCCFPDSNGC